MRYSLFQIQRKRTCVSEVSLLDCLQMASAFSEARRAARLLQQFGGFHFCRDDIRFSLLSVQVCHTPQAVPAALYLRGVCLRLGTLGCSAQRRGVLPRRVSSLVMGM